MDWIPKGFTTEHTKNHGDARRIFASMGHAPDTNMVLVPWIWSHLFRENHGNSMESPDTCILVLYSSAAAAAVAYPFLRGTPWLFVVSVVKFF
jgi:hypothetical protein